jgi:hypothetical protein
MKQMVRTIAMLLLAPACAASAPPQSVATPAATVAPAPAQASAAPASVSDAAAPQPVATPDTPAGRVLQAWLDAFNSGDKTQIEAFLTKYKDKTPAEELLMFRQQTGGLDLLGIDASERLRVTFRVRDKATPTVGLGVLRVTDTDPPVIDQVKLRAIPPGKTAADMDMNVKVDAALRARVIDGIVAKLNELYVFPEVAKKMESALRAHQKNGDYDAIGEGDAFAERLTDDLRAVSHDKHLGVDCSPLVLPKDEPKDDHPHPDPEMRAMLERLNCGFEKADRLDSNIGYVKFNFFGDSDICGPRATAAMEALGDIGAIIFDLRDNDGGQPAMVAFVASYLFKKRTHLNDIYERKSNKTTEYWTKPDVPGRKFPDAPVFVLTSHRTFSGAEEFAYDLKNLKRATLVGETTGGGAHPTGDHRVDDHFAVAVPEARAVNPISKTDWEGTGVEPDVKVPADQALDVAKKLAAEKIAKRTQSPR